MRANVISGPCPGFGIRMCLSCKKPWVSSAPDICREINRTCPDCLAYEPLMRWEDWARPQTVLHEQRIQHRLAELRRRKELSVKQQREDIVNQRRTA